MKTPAFKSFLHLFLRIPALVFYSIIVAARPTTGGSQSLHRQIFGRLRASSSNLTNTFKQALILISILFTAFVNAQPLFTYGNKAVTKEEFIRAFNKNPGTEVDRKKALKEYLDLYINYKLKVQAAYDAGMQNNPDQQAELENFKRQIAENIINEEAGIDNLVQEAFERSRKDIRLSQVFIEVQPGEDTIEAHRKIQAAYKALQQGKDFSEVTGEFSTDSITRQSGGDIGFITVFSLPYEIENVVYSLKPNGFSAPVKSSIGYHIFKNTAERKAVGTRKVAQILIAIPPDATPQQKADVANRADSVYNLLIKGASFENLVRSVSNDALSYNNNGELAEFGVGQYSPAFEQAAFSLTKRGDISKPFETAYGYHILKLLEAKPVASNLNDALTAASLKEKVQKDGRLIQAKQSLVNKYIRLTKYKPAVYNEQDLWRYTDSAMHGKRGMLKVNDNTLLFSFPKQNIKAGDWIKYVSSQAGSAGTPRPDYKSLMNEYIETAATEYYKNHLEDYKPQYKLQMDEFKEANLLFGIMEKQVWSKAATDTAGLLSYYNQNKQKYRWTSSADALIITCNTEQIAGEIKAKVTENRTSWRTVAETYGSNVAADSGRYEISQLQATEKNTLSPGLITMPVKNDDGAFTFNYIIKIYPQAEQRSFDDARGMVISDYQQSLEDKWIAALKKKYPVKVNGAVFNSLK